ncbi:hypothetical protein [Halosimplex pelagicum]|uniref:Uncharacterized protein n=1 Tax=Halosimplex pelagicum TaxID=869886 RepID=A0A7D5PDJ9_9EURY|nr:hypothetical protein [Halosimplex pelagicum]QLH81040.1 hypothetical protein HZS54_05035 [Halosimplex pelagicum]
MPPTIRAALREEFDYWWVFAVVSAVTLLAGTLDATAAELAVVLGAFHAEKGFDAVEAAGETSRRVAKASTALVAAVGTGALLVLGSGPSLVAMLLLACLACAAQAAKASLVGAEPDGDRPADGARAADPADRAVLAALDERPRTRRELREAVDEDPVDAGSDAIDAALDRLRDRGAVERAGSEYRVAPEPDPGFVERLRSLVSGRGRATDRGRASSGRAGGRAGSYEAGLSSVTSGSERAAGDTGTADGRETAGGTGDRENGGRDGAAADERGRDRERGREYEAADR